MAQPDPWAYTWLGTAGWLGPYMPTRQPYTVYDQPIYDRRRLQTILELAQLGQPDPWAYTWLGTANNLGPFMPMRLPAGAPGVDWERPQPNGPDPWQQWVVQPTYQVDPWWPGALIESANPYSPRITNPQNYVTEVDQPQPFANLDVYPQAQWLNQPDLTFSWIYMAAQPYQPRQLNPTAMDVRVDFPPPNVLDQITDQIYLASQPDPWVYAFIGSAQPYGRRIANEALFGLTATQPIAGVRQAIGNTIISAWVPPDPIAALYPPNPYKTKITVRIGRSQGIIIT
jgi:hypothetical protein